ncbi:uncharacterized protein LOC125235564 [Leguminivora glycinivorella]|uniref:uncharacterized protein LOC125235564 n=1 Tax=Leguminivora glycinivorella TaxID=1035111 RepID=UPI00200C089F|nr:uncharacterized protein LOC125235564 [Leguminivora glycinivorella]
MSVGKIKAFEVSSGNWSTYVDRVNMYFKANDISDNLQLPTLIAVMGDEAYELLSNLTSPKKPGEMTYKEVIKIMSDHIEPKPSFMAERYRLRQRRQGDKETVAQYLADLKKMARYCDFSTALEDNLRDQFVCGLKNDTIRQRLFAESDLTYSKAVQLALSLEAAEKDAAMVERASVSETGDAGERAETRRQRRGPAPGAGGRRGAQRANRASAIHHVQAEDGETQYEEEVTSGSDFEEDLHHLCLNDYKSVSLSLGLDDEVISMEIDTGCAVSCIGRDTYNKYFKHRPLEQFPLVLTVYDGRPVRPLGVIRPVVRFKNQLKKLELFVIEGGTTPILGRHWLTELQIRIPRFRKEYLYNFNESCNNELSTLLDRYKELFSGGLGRFRGGKATLRVREGATPVFCRARPLPYALRDRVEAELDEMLRCGVIEPVDTSEWATPLVPVRKADGGLRICADYKVPRPEPVEHSDEAPDHSDHADTPVATSTPRRSHQSPDSSRAADARPGTPQSSPRSSCSEDLFLSPTTSTTPPSKPPQLPRHIRECRLKNPPKYKF